MEEEIIIDQGLGKEQGSHDLSVLHSMEARNLFQAEHHDARPSVAGIAPGGKARTTRQISK